MAVSLEKYGSSVENFPYKSFYNSEENEAYVFYRQGHSFRVPIKEIVNEEVGATPRGSTMSMY